MPCPNCVCKDCDHFFRRPETYVECICTDYNRGDAICMKEHRPAKEVPNLTIDIDEYMWEFGPNPDPKPDKGEAT